MGEQAIQLLCEQFAPDEDELVEGEEDDVDMNGKADEDAPASDSESDNESQSSAAGDDGESDGGIDLDADPELRDKVAAALGMAGIAANEEAESDEGEILLDDDQMMALDDQLAAAFKAHSSDRKSAKGQFVRNSLYVRADSCYRCQISGSPFTAAVTRLGRDIPEARIRECPCRQDSLGPLQRRDSVARDRRSRAHQQSKSYTKGCNYEAQRISSWRLV